MNEAVGFAIGAGGTMIGILLGSWLYYRWQDWRWRKVCREHNKRMAQIEREIAERLDAIGRI